MYVSKTNLKTPTANTRSVNRRNKLTIFLKMFSNLLIMML